MSAAHRGLLSNCMISSGGKKTESLFKLSKKNPKKQTKLKPKFFLLPCLLFVGLNWPWTALHPPVKTALPPLRLKESDLRFRWRFRLCQGSNWGFASRYSQGRESSSQCLYSQVVAYLLLSLHAPHQVKTIYFHCGSGGKTKWMVCLRAARPWTKPVFLQHSAWARCAIKTTFQCCLLNENWLQISLKLICASKAKTDQCRKNRQRALLPQEYGVCSACLHMLKGQISTALHLTRGAAVSLNVSYRH